jgi:hypothetical protein
VLEKSIATVKVDVGATSEMGGLLEKDGVWAKDLADVDRDFLEWSETVALEAEEWLTSFWAEKTEFMIGMYEVARSGETERMRRRGSGRVLAAGPSARRLTSRCRVVSRQHKATTRAKSVQQRALVIAAIRAEGSAESSDKASSSAWIRRVTAWSRATKGG